MNATAIDSSHHLPLVKKVARNIARRLPRQVEVDDLVGAGNVGLVDAAARFDPGRASFEQYAEIRIRGAILDYLRGLDWMPRTLRSRGRQIESAQRDLTRSLGRAPATAEIAEKAGVHETDVVASRLVRSIVQMDSQDLENLGVDGRQPGDPLERRELYARLKDAVSRLPARTQELLAFYYVHELTLKDIGARFGVTESRACQLHGHALKRLREELADDADAACFRAGT